jgi:curli biogenesis system outer membrane secretion channel CsgG
LAGENIGPVFSKWGETMSTMLASSLEQIICFNLLDRDALVELKKEMELAGRD